jgi:hypothetical protein
MKNWIKQNWRETVGWILIVYSFLIFCSVSPFHYESGRGNPFETFEASVILTILVLSWLRLNKNK